MNPQTNQTQIITKTSPKDFFLNLGALIALYVSVYAILNLVFSIINFLSPDQLSGYFYSNMIAWPISILIILTPALYAFEYFILKDIKENQDKKNIWVYRWRIFLTLFLAGAVIGTDLIVLIYTYLGGEISSRFIFKVLAVLVITGSIFKYYFYTLNDSMKWASLAKKTAPWSGLVMVVAAIVTGFVLVGSPAKQRAIRFDTQRVSNLQNIQYQILSYWQTKKTVPTTLEAMNDSFSGQVVPVDTETGASYEYRMKDANSFELCANFSLDYVDTRGRGSAGYVSSSMDYAYPVGYFSPTDNWKYKKGRTCFERSIDPEKYSVDKRNVY
jgi:hypothetical protein